MHSYLSRYKWFLVWAEVQRPSPRQNKCMDREVFLFVFRWFFLAKYLSRIIICITIFISWWLQIHLLWEGLICSLSFLSGSQSYKAPVAEKLVCVTAAATATEAKRKKVAELETWVNFHSDRTTFVPNSLPTHHQFLATSGFLQRGIRRKDFFPPYSLVRASFQNLRILASLHFLIRSYLPAASSSSCQNKHGFAWQEISS